MRTTRSSHEAGTLFFASSAGGVYAGSCGAAAVRRDLPGAALAPYGREKLPRRTCSSGCRACGVELLIGRLSNLYGPGQNLSKPQGLIAHVGHAALRRRAGVDLVPLDTIRDYLFAPDAGRMSRAIERHEATARRSARDVTKIFASEVETTVATVLGTWRRVLRRPLRVALAGSPAGRLQPRVLSFRSASGPTSIVSPPSFCSASTPYAAISWGGRVAGRRLLSAAGAG